MIELEKEEYIILPMMEHEGEKSLDAIATKFYGKQYKGQQTGDMMAQSSWHVFDLRTEYDVEDYQPEDCYKPLSRWLALELGDEIVEDWYGAGERKKVAEYDFDIYREAPMPEYILADLIRNGVLPHGKYLVHVWW
jgi:hypothetical protein